MPKSAVIHATLLAHSTEMRALSVQEYARIQQFPDFWKFQGKLSDIYRQIGNAVPVGMGYVVDETILDFHLSSCLAAHGHVMVAMGFTFRHPPLTNLNPHISLFKARMARLDCHISKTFD
jgi:hypothetical protein